MSNYSNKTDIESFLGRSLTDNENNLLAKVLDTVDNWINHKLGSVFGVVAESIKYYDGGSSILEIDPCRDVTAVYLVDNDETILHTYTHNEDYEIEPRNETIKNWIQNRYGKFPSGICNIGVKATFSLGDEVPSDISYLATYLASKLFVNAKTTSKGLERESIEGYSRTFAKFVTEDSQATMILNRFTEEEFFI